MEKLLRGLEPLTPSLREAAGVATKPGNKRNFEKLTTKVTTAKGRGAFWCY